MTLCAPHSARPSAWFPPARAGCGCPATLTPAAGPPRPVSRRQSVAAQQPRARPRARRCRARGLSAGRSPAAGSIADHLSFSLQSSTKIQQRAAQSTHGSAGAVNGCGFGGSGHSGCLANNGHPASLRAGTVRDEVCTSTSIRHPSAAEDCLSVTCCRRSAPRLSAARASSARCASARSLCSAVLRKSCRRACRRRAQSSSAPGNTCSWSSSSSCGSSVTRVRLEGFDLG